MQMTKLIAPLLLSAASAMAVAAPPPKAVLLDHSSGALMDAATARALLGDGIPAKVWKLYPASKWAFSSQVEGGLTSSGTCVVTARVMLLPLTPTMKATLFRPQKTATTFDAQAVKKQLGIAVSQWDSFMYRMKTLSERKVYSFLNCRDELMYRGDIL